MLFDDNAFEPAPLAMNNCHYEEGIAPLNDEDESPVLSCLRSKPRVERVRDLTCSRSTLSTSSQSSLSCGLGDDDSLCPLDAFDDNDELMAGTDSHLVDFALRISQDSVNDFDDSNSRFSLDDTSLNLDILNDDDDLAIPLPPPVAPARDPPSDNLQTTNLQTSKATDSPAPQDPMTSLNQSIASLNEAFEKLSACMERTNQTRTMLKQYSGAVPTTGTGSRSVSRSNSNRSLSRSNSNRSLRGGLSRSNSNNSLNSLGSNKSLSSLGRKSKTPRKLRRSVKNDLTRGGLIRRPMPQIVLNANN